MFVDSHRVTTTQQHIELYLKHACSKMQSVILLLLALIPLSLSLPHIARGQFILQSGLMDEMVRRGEELVYNMEFDAADRTFDSVIAINPKFPAGYFYKAMVNFWRAVTNPDNTSYDEAYNRELQIHFSMLTITILPEYSTKARHSGCTHASSPFARNGKTPSASS